MSLTKTVGRLLPFRQLAEEDVVNQFSSTVTGELGTIVSISAGNFDDQHNWNFGAPVGANFDGISSFMYETQTKVRPCASGDSKDNILGITLMNVATHDENGENLKFYPQKRLETHTVLTGDSLPVASKGYFMVTSKAWTNGTGNLPQIGDVGIASTTENGKLQFVSRAELTGLNFDESHIVAKVLGTGAKFGGFAYISFNAQ